MLTEPSKKGESMFAITIDQDRCKKDGLCEMVCPKNVFIQKGKMTVPEVAEEELCIACGQCVGICRQDAIRHSEFPSEKISPIHLEEMPKIEQVMTLIKTRRSIRTFRDKPLEKATIEKIIDGARFAPSGHNSQSTEFLVIRDKDLLNKVSALVVDYLKFEIKRFKNPLFRTFALLGDRAKAESGLKEIPGFKRMIKAYESGADPVHCDAPALLVFHARRTVGFADVNAQLALQNASLVSHSLGIGHFYTGWIVATCRAAMSPAWNSRMTRLMGIPPENKLHGALALGYPVPKFKNMIERNSPRIKWI
jgi:nitroreductase/NAD-dependent dihydropyrimidine dehydrogenase PreA subunit